MQEKRTKQHPSKPNRKASGNGDEATPKNRPAAVNQPQSNSNHKVSGNGDEATPKTPPAAVSTEQQAGNVTPQERAAQAGASLNRPEPEQLPHSLRSRCNDEAGIARDGSPNGFVLGGRLVTTPAGYRSLQRGRLQSPSLWTPQIDVQQRNHAIIVRADLPGVRKEDVQIEVDDGALIISGQRREEDGGQGQGYRTLERSYGGFYRTVPLPHGTNPDDIKAEMRDGVLKITFPEHARRRRIQIQS